MSRHGFPSLAASLCALPVALLAGGCGSSQIPTYAASGTVVFDDGRPVPFGVVEFRSDNGQIARGKLDERGKFELSTFSAGDGAVAGRQQAIVVQHLAPNQASALEPGRHEEHAAHDLHPVALVSPEYAAYGTTPLDVQIEPTAENHYVLKVRRFSPPNPVGRKPRS